MSETSSKRRRAAYLAIGAVAGVALGGGVAFAAIPNAGGEYTGCVKSQTGVLRVVDFDAGQRCQSAEKQITWNATGPMGPMGPQGLQGEKGEKGEKGDPGAGTTAFGADTTATTATTAGDCVLGQVLLNASQQNWSLGVPADGRVLPINQNLALFSLYGTRYGGDGRATFALPDLRNAAPNGTYYGICTEGIYPAPR